MDKKSIIMWSLVILVNLLAVIAVSLKNVSEVAYWIIFGLELACFFGVIVCGVLSIIDLIKQYKEYKKRMEELDKEIKEIIEKYNLDGEEDERVS